MFVDIFIPSDILAILFQRMVFINGLIKTLCNTCYDTTTILSISRIYIYKNKLKPVYINSGDVVKVRRTEDTTVLLTFSIHN